MASFIDIIQEVVLDQVNEWRTETEENPTCVQDLDQYKKWEANIPRHDGSKRREYLTKLKFQRQRINNKWATSESFPFFVNSNVPKILHSKLCNNQWDINYGHVSTDLDSDQMANWWKVASANRRSQRYTAADRVYAKEAMRTLSKTMGQRFFHTCQIEEVCNRCAMPNSKRTPDISVVLIPDSCKTHMKMPIFTFEVIGKKSILGNHEKQYPGYTASCQVLAFQPEAYYGKVTRNIVTLCRLQKVPDLGTIQITQKDYHYATRKFEEVMETLVEDLVKIFLYQFIGMTFINFETSKLLKLASYEDFIAEKDRMKLRCEKCHWHFSEVKFIGHLGPELPHEYLRNDKFDPYHTEKYPTYPSVPLAIVGDLLEPVYPSPHTHREIEQYIENLKEKIKAPNQLNPLLITRAVHDVNNGHPLNPQNKKSWSQAALGLTAELEGNYIADTDKSALDTSRTVFGNILDPGYPYPGDGSVHRMVVSTPLARFSSTTAPTRDILETPSDTSTIGDDPAAPVSRKMGRDVYPFPSPSTVSSTPSRASTLARELPPDLPGSSTGGTPFATPKQVEAVKRQVLQTTTPPYTRGAQQVATTPQQGHGAQQLATTPRGVEGAQQLATTAGQGDGAQQLATTPRGVEGAQQLATTP